MNVLVTGSTSGLGFYLAKEFTEQGKKVFLNGTDQKKLNKAKEELSLEGLISDVTNPSQSDELVREVEKNLGFLDSVVCNVGSGKSKKPGEEDYDEWLRMIKLNLLSSVNIVNSLKKYSKSKKISIICISSICGKEFIKGAPLSYSASKAALNQFVKVASEDLYSYGFRINAVLPGNIIFPGSTWEDKINNEPELVDKTLQSTAMKKLGSTEEIFNVVNFLASPQSSFLTGTLITADGGQTRST
tara:strand:- start:807 stop:1538 length:732 start_codon:yes stop_codon:yes gene_type:complete